MRISRLFLSLGERHPCLFVTGGFFVSWVVLMFMGARVTASEAAPRLGVTLECLLMWVNAGKVSPVGKRNGRWPEYLWGDLLAVEAKTRREKRGRRRKVAA